MTLIEVFLPTARERLGRLREALVAEDDVDAAAEFGRDAHTLRGSAATAGFLRAASLAGDLESALEGGDLQAARTAADDLSSELELVLTHARTVLCVEDDPVNLLLVERTAARVPGVRLLTARSGTDGLAIAHRESPDLVLLDLLLPDAEGEDVLRRLREDPATAHIPVAILSADTRSERVAELRAAGAAEYLPKPLDLDRLVALLDARPATDGAPMPETLTWALLDVLFATTPVGLAFVDPDLRFVLINERLAEINGRPVEEHLGRTLRDVVPTLADRLEPLYRSVLDTGQAVLDVEVSGETPAAPGIVRHWVSSYIPVTQADRRIGLLAVVEETTRLREAEREVAGAARELLETTELLEALHRSAPVAIVTTAPDGTLTSWSPAGERMFGWSGDELLGQSRVFVPAELADEAQALYDRAAAGETTVEVETKRRRKDGSLADVSLSLAPLRDADGAFAGLVGVLADISARKQVEAELERRRRELEVSYETALRLIEQRDARSVLETVVARAAELMCSDGAYVYEIDPGGETLTVTVTFGEAVRYHGTRLRRGEALAGLVVETGSPQVVDDYFAWPDRAAFIEPARFGAVAAAPLHVGDEVVGVLGVTRDTASPFSDEDLALLKRFGHLASLALSSARLWDGLRESEERLRLAAQTAGMGLWSSDLVSDAIVHDDLTERMLGRPVRNRHELLERVHPGDREIVVAAIDGALAGETPFAVHCRVVSPAGETKWLASRASIVRAATGTPLQMIGVSFDITERKQAEDELRQYVERLATMREVDEALLAARSTEQIAEAALARARSLIGAARVGVSLVDFEADELVGVAFSEEAAVGPLNMRIPLAPVESALEGGLRREDVIRVADLTAVPAGTPNAAELLRSGIRSLLVVPLRAGHELIGVLWCHYNEPGPPCTETEVEIAREVAGLLAVALDHARREEALRTLTAELEARVLQRTRELEAARAEAERANAAKSEFLSRMSHELRTPLNAILGFAQLLQRDELDPERRDSVDQILDAGRHLLGLVEELLDVSRIEAGVLEVEPHPLPLAEIVAHALELVQPLASARNVTLSGVPREAREAVVLADRRRLLQVVLNLLSNAVKFNRPGGRVDVGYSRVGAERAELSVSDTGIGMSEADADRIFLPFERVRGTGEQDGAGLGLSVARSLVEAMGGSIRAESRLGEGSRFVVQLPLASEDAAVTAHIASARTRTVLLIEDNLRNARLVEQALAELPGTRVLSVRNGADALAAVRAETPDLILLDLGLPDVAGDDVLRSLREDGATATVPVVVVSADATFEAKEQLLAAGAVDFLSKPVDVDRLLELVRRV